MQHIATSKAELAAEPAGLGVLGALSNESGSRSPSDNGESFSRILHEQKEHSSAVQHDRKHDRKAEVEVGRKETPAHSSDSSENKDLKNQVGRENRADDPTSSVHANDNNTTDENAAQAVADKQIGQKAASLETQQEPHKVAGKQGESAEQDVIAVDENWVEQEEHDIDWLALVEKGRLAIKVEDGTTQVLAPNTVETSSEKVSVEVKLEEEGEAPAPTLEQIAQWLESKKQGSHVSVESILPKQQDGAEVDVEADSSVADIVGQVLTQNTDNGAQQEQGNQESLSEEQYAVLTQRLLELLQSGEEHAEDGAYIEGQLGEQGQNNDALNEELISTIIHPVEDDREQLDDELALEEALQTQAVPNVEVKPVIRDEAIQITIEENVAPVVAVVNNSDSQDADKPSGEKALAQLAQLPPQKLDKALDNLAKRLQEVKVSEEAQVESVLNKTSQLETSLTEIKPTQAKAEFVSAMKAGIAEIKEQLKQGHEPGIDLKALVKDAMQGEAQLAQAASQVPQKLEQSLQAFTQALDVSSKANVTLEQQVAALAGEKRQIAEVTQGQLESNKGLSTPLEKPVNITKPEGQQQLAEKVRYMVNAKNMQAEIRLDPPDLGGMQIKLSLNGEAASVSFVVQSQQARDVLEQAVPKLRDMLSEQGIELGQSSVEQEQKDGAEDGEAQAGNNGNDAELAEEDGNIHEQRIVNGRLGGIDYFA